MPILGKIKNSKEVVHLFVDKDAGSFHAVSFSGGKDSTYMLLRMIEKGLPVDAVLYADTGMEFPEMYDHIARIDTHLFQQRGIHITRLKHPKGFEYLMFDEPRNNPA